MQTRSGRITIRRNYQEAHRYGFAYHHQVNDKLFHVGYQGPYFLLQDKKHTVIKDDKMNDDLKIHILLTQYSVKKGLKVFGKKGKQSLRREFKQFNVMEVRGPIQIQDLTKERQRHTLRYLIFMK
mmetsp:Transcript_22638/g.31948  ORF Transcript_22638/g.31948 Transcript_22638/m.31948 type:complete len:125 (-) Transcript_22638:1664-2038(-)